MERSVISDFMAANAFIASHLAGALLLGVVVGYERSYQGRAAGMRTYGLVCMASAAVTMFVGYAHLWFQGSITNGIADADPRSVVQGVLTGVGFLGAGVIVHDGLTIRGLTTAASIWAVAVVGVLLGVGFYPAALTLALLCTLSLSVLNRVKVLLPARSTLDVTLTFVPGHAPCLEDVERRARAQDSVIQRDSLTVSYSEGRLVWRFSVVAQDRMRVITPAALAEEFVASQVMSSFSIVPVRF
jgi:putative Mg2+ transporter-C (MgtC) family protein